MKKTASLLFTALLASGCVSAQKLKTSIGEMPSPINGEKCKMFSSWDRSGGNNDGFRGTYSKIRLEDGNSVIAEMKGAGCITRIWVTHSHNVNPGLFNKKNEHIKIYFDGSDKPQIDVPLEQVFYGKVKGFPGPLVGHGTGGFFCYVPIFYKNGCKVVIEGDAMKFYQVTYTEFDSAKAVKKSGLCPKANKKIIQTLNISGTNKGKPLVNSFNLKAGEEKVIKLPSKTAKISSVFLGGSDKQKLLKGRIKFFWDGSKEPAIDLPISQFFAHTKETKEYKSLLTGSNPNGFYNLMPMPFANGAVVKISFPEDVKGKVVFTLQKASKASLQNRLYTNYVENLPTVRGKFIDILQTKGKGQFIGCFIDTRSKKLYAHGCTHWLEGDEIVTVDGKMDYHGTGTEDYFNCGWYQTEGRLMGAGTYPFHGFTTYNHKLEPEAYASAYRWHLTDPIPFNESIHFQLEHGPGNNYDVDYRTTAFYYLTK